MEHANHIEPGRVTTRVLEWTDRHRRLLFILLGVFYLAGFNGQWRVGPDSAAFATVARSIAEGHGFEHPTGFAGNASPATIYLLAASFKLLGNDTFWPVLVLFFLLAMGTLVLVHRTFLLHADRPTAVVITLMVGVSSIFYRYTFDVLNDVPFLFGVMLLLWSYERHRHGVGRPVVNYAVMALSFIWMAAFRIVFINVLAAWLVVMFVQAMRSPKRRRTIGAILVVIGLMALLRYLDPRARDGGLLPREQEIVTRLSDMLSDTLLNRVPDNTQRLMLDEGPNALFGNQLGLAPLNFAVAFAAIAGMIALARMRLLWGVMVILFLIQWLLFFADARYFVALLPLMAFAWWRLGAGVEARWPSRGTSILFIVMLGLWPLMNVARSAGILIEQRRVPFLDNYRHRSVRGLREFSLTIMERTDRDCWIVGSMNNASLVTYWSRRSVFPPVTHWSSLNMNARAYIITPLSAEQKELLANPNLGWEVGPDIFSVPGKPGEEPWTLRQLLTPANRSGTDEQP
ncbi:MAG: hypothetical protein WD768_12450 [Phycisphaeraceae bacterium]